jgi:hypothetical protein
MNMRNEVIAPINHGVLSTASTTAVEAGKSGIYGLLKGALVGIGLTAGLLGAVALGFGATLATAATVAALGTGVAITAAAFGAPVVGSLIGISAGLGSLAGGFKGASRGLERVGQERGAANMLSAQVDAYKAQNQPQTVVYAPSASNHQSFPAQGSPMNQAGSTVTNAQYMDRVNGAELAAARA